VIRWHDARGVEHQTIISRSALPSPQGGAVIASKLEDEGLRCSANSGLLRSFFSGLRTRKILTIVASTGWHKTQDDSWVYVLPTGETIGSRETNVILAPGALRSGSGNAAAGSLEEWQQNVAKYAVGNSRHAFFLSSTFAGALLAINSEPSGGFHLVGGSRMGKTTAQSMAASAWGQPKKRIAQWRTTANGAEGMARAASDGPLFLDEIGQADARRADEMIYMLANESGKQRAKVDGSMRERASWRVVYLSTGEIGLAVKMAEANKSAATGLEVRLVNIEADAGRGLGAFEDLHGFASGADLADHLRMAANTYYGTASRLFLEEVAKMRSSEPEALAEFIAQMRHEFRKQYVNESKPDGQVESVAGRFALVAAAGELAIHFGVLNWPTGEAIKAAGKCFTNWLATRGHTGAGEDEAAIKHVRRFIMAHGSSRFAPYDAPDEAIRDRVGWRRVECSSTDYLFQKDQWDFEIFKGTTINPKRALDALDRLGHLKTQEGRMTSKVKISGEQLRVVWVYGTILAEQE
jgi:putative DNA primase/helicase